MANSSSELQELKELEELEKLEALAGNSKEDTSPFKYKPRMQTMPDDLSRMTSQIDVTPDYIKQAAQAGVDVDTGAPGMPFGKASFAFDDTQALQYMKQSLDKKYGSDVPVRAEGPQSGKPEYFNPSTNRWTLIGPSSLGEELKSHLGSAIPNVLGTAGAVAGAAIPQGPGTQIFTGAAGAGIGQGVGELARTSIGDVLGVNDGITMGQQVGGAAIEGSKAAALDLTASSIFQTGRLIRYVMKGKPVFTETMARNLEANQKRYTWLIDELEQGSGSKFATDASFAPDTRVLTEGEKSATEYARTRMSSVLGSDEFAQKAAEKAAGNERTLELYFENKLGAGAQPAEQAGMPMRGAIQGQRQTALEGPQQALEGAQAEGRGIYDSLPSSLYGARSGAGREVRQELQARHDVAAQAEKEYWSQYQDSIMYDPTVNKSSLAIPLGKEEMQEFRNFRTRIENTLSKRQAGGREALIPGIDVPEAVSKEDAQLLDSFKVKYDDKKPTVDVAQLDDFIKWLRAKKRLSMEDKVNAEFGDKDLLDMEKFAVKLRNQYLEKEAPGAYEALMKAEGASRIKNEVFNRGVIADALSTTSSGQYVLNDADVLFNVVKRNDSNASRDMAEVLKSNPTAFNSAQNMIYAMYRKKAFVNGLPNTKAHQRFMETYGDTIAPFFPNTKKLDSYLDMAKGLADAEVTYRTAKAAWKDDILGGFDNLSSENLVKLAFSGSNKASVENLAKLKARVQGIDPAIVDSWKAGVANEIKLRVVTKEGLDMNALEKVLEISPKLTPVMGSNYVRSLETLRDGLTILEKSAKNAGLPPRQGRLQYGLRILEGPMTRGGRVMTFTGNERSKAFFAKIWNALHDPAELRKLANFTSRQVQLQGKMQVGAVGSQLLEDDQDEYEGGRY